MSKYYVIVMVLVYKEFSYIFSLKDLTSVIA